MDRHRIVSGSRFEPEIGFSRALRVGALVLVSGTGPVWADGSCDPEPETQARRCLEIISEALEQAGSGIGDAEAVGRAHATLFAVVRPAATMVVVAGLLDPRWKVEIEAEALTQAD